MSKIHPFYQKAKKWTGKIPFLSSAALWWTLGAFLDELSTGIRKLPAGAEESNPYARSVTGEFIWRHAAFYDLFQLALFASIGLIVYYGLQKGLSKQLKWMAQAPGASLFLYYGLERYLAAFSNLYLRLGWLNQISTVINSFFAVNRFHK